MVIVNAFENCYAAFYLNNGKIFLFILSFGDFRKLHNFIVPNF